ncbi:hypothetical protein H072_433 [Dactylellina haptotyla CBS 200.50]|uniref:Uncharacterized protein n=1 Tax=Dactylellina haptotyla (strain CBS 200.50) TaxID=1284197 RepID=S8C1C7_DACHA|nr:hypothetical protein H072_433 [Dactylellina haptotyla CBS 200.50]
MPTNSTSDTPGGYVTGTVVVSVIETVLHTVTGVQTVTKVVGGGEEGVGRISSSSTVNTGVGAVISDVPGTEPGALISGISGTEPGAIVSIPSTSTTESTSQISYSPSTIYMVPGPAPVTTSQVISNEETQSTQLPPTSSKLATRESPTWTSSYPSIRTSSGASSSQQSQASSSSMGTPPPLSSPPTTYIPFPISTDGMSSSILIPVGIIALPDGESTATSETVLYTDTRLPTPSKTIVQTGYIISNVLISPSVPMTGTQGSSNPTDTVNMQSGMVIPVTATDVPQFAATIISTGGSGKAGPLGSVGLLAIFGTAGLLVGGVF